MFMWSFGALVMAHKASKLRVALPEIMQRRQVLDADRQKAGSYTALHTVFHNLGPAAPLDPWGNYVLSFAAALAAPALGETFAQVEKLGSFTEVAAQEWCYNWFKGLKISFGSE